MPFVLDTNILLRLAEPSDPEYPAVRTAVETLAMSGETLVITAQNVTEFWNVCTRPVERNGFGLTPAQTDERVALLEARFRRLPDSDEVYSHWRRLVVAHSVSGVQVHDARLVAAMLAHGVPRILTLNPRDFHRFAGVEAVHPRDVRLPGSH